tara:strand:+ start:615 stop:815 length:201 start_codon:yes stop_codon:yes gene_type:complete
MVCSREGDKNLQNRNNFEDSLPNLDLNVGTFDNQALNSKSKQSLTTINNNNITININKLYGSNPMD